MKEVRSTSSNSVYGALLQHIKITILTVAVLLLPSAAFANFYPATLDNGNLVWVDGGMGMGCYADRTSVVIEQYEPPNYQIAISVVSVSFSDEYWRQHETYVGGPYRIGKTFLLRFRYNWDRKSIAYIRRDYWQDWDINRDCSHADGNPLVPNAAEVAFVSAYNMRFFGDKTGYSPVLKRQRRVIDESLYQALGIEQGKLSMPYKLTRVGVLTLAEATKRTCMSEKAFLAGMPCCSIIARNTKIYACNILSWEIC